MQTRTIGIALILASVCLLTATQLLIKARLTGLGDVPMNLGGMAHYVLKVIRDLPLLAGGCILVVAALCWYGGLSRLPLSLAFPLGALSYPLVLIGSLVVLKEQFSWQLVAGNLMILGGVVVVAVGHGH